MPQGKILAVTVGCLRDLLEFVDWALLPSGRCQTKFIHDFPRLNKITDKISYKHISVVARFGKCTEAEVKLTVTFS